MDATLSILLWWLAFAGSHVVLSSMSVRQPLVDRLGEQTFRGLYSLIAFATFVPLVWTYATHKHNGVLLWALPVGGAPRGITYLVMIAAFVLLTAAFAHPSPAAVVPGAATPTGAFQITRHPLLMGLGLFGLAHLIPNGFASDVIFFGGFPLFAVLGAWHQDQRKLATQTPGYREFCAATPFLPFTGSNTLQGVRELGLRILGIGITVAVVIRIFHGRLFGG